MGMQACQEMRTGPRRAAMNPMQVACETRKRRVTRYGTHSQDFMETSFGIAGKGFTLLAADSTAAHSIVKVKSDEDKFRSIGDNLLFCYNGAPGDTVHFAEFVEANLKLEAIRNHAPVLPDPAASWIRKSLADSLRSRHPYQVNLLLGGYDSTTKNASLYWLDYLGTRADIPYAAHGYGAYFCLSTMDRYYEPGCTLEEALVLLRRCINEIQKRLVISFDGFKIKVVDSDGVKDLTEAFKAVQVPLGA